MPLRIGIGAAGRVIARFVDGVGDPRFGAQRRLQPFGAQRPRPGGGGQPGFPLEEAMEMMRGIADMGGDRLQPGRILGRFDHRDGGAHRQPIPPDFIGAAAQAGAEARRARGRGIGQEGHVLPPGMARGAAWLAIDAGGGDAADELPVHRPVAAQEGGPAGIGIGHGGRGEASHMLHGYRAYSMRPRPASCALRSKHFGFSRLHRAGHCI